MWPIPCALLIDSPSFPVSKDCKISSIFNTVIQGFIQKPYEQNNITFFFSTTPPFLSFLASKVRSLNQSTNEKKTDIGKIMRFSLKWKFCKGCKWDTEDYSGLEKFLLSLALKVCQWITEYQICKIQEQSAIPRPSSNQSTISQLSILFSSVIIAALRYKPKQLRLDKGLTLKRTIIQIKIQRWVGIKHLTLSVNIALSKFMKQCKVLIDYFVQRF